MQRASVIAKYTPSEKVSKCRLMALRESASRKERQKKVTRAK